MNSVTSGNLHSLLKNVLFVCLASVRPISKSIHKWDTHNGTLDIVSGWRLCKKDLRWSEAPGDKRLSVNKLTLRNWSEEGEMESKFNDAVYQGRATRSLTLSTKVYSGNLIGDESNFEFWRQKLSWRPGRRIHQRSEELSMGLIFDCPIFHGGKCAFYYWAEHVPRVE